MTARYSLHFGLNDYSALTRANIEGTFRNLLGCVNDAVSWRRFAAEKLAIPNANQKLFINPEEVTKPLVLAEMEKLFRQLAPGDVCLITYSGHGVQAPSYDPTTTEPNGYDQCLVTSDFTWREPLRDNDLARVLELQPRDALCVLIVDTCHSGGVTRLVAMEAEQFVLVRTIEPPPRIIHDLLIAQSRQPPPVGGSGFGPVNTFDHLVLFAACDREKLARETYYSGEFRGAFSLVMQQAIESLGPANSNTAIFTLAGSKLLTLGMVQNPQLETSAATMQKPFWPGAAA